MSSPRVRFHCRHLCIVLLRIVVAQGPISLVSVGTRSASERGNAEFVLRRWQTTWETGATYSPFDTSNHIPVGGPGPCVICPATLETAKAVVAICIVWKIVGSHDHIMARDFLIRASIQHGKMAASSTQFFGCSYSLKIGLLFEI